MFNEILSDFLDNKDRFATSKYLVATHSATYVSMLELRWAAVLAVSRQRRWFVSLLKL